MNVPQYVWIKVHKKEEKGKKSFDEFFEEYRLYIQLHKVKQKSHYSKVLNLYKRGWVVVVAIFNLLRQGICIKR